MFPDFEKNHLSLSELKEVVETLHCIKDCYNTCDGKFYTVNLKGHGCLIMAGADDLDKMFSAEFYVRQLPEYM